MGKYYYDLHIHSCLSPCGDADMTPANIAGMAAVAIGFAVLLAITVTHLPKTEAVSRD